MATAHQKIPPSVRCMVPPAERDHAPLGACMNSTRGGRMEVAGECLWSQAGVAQGSPSGIGSFPAASGTGSNEVPHPQLLAALGLTMRNPASARSSA